MGLLTESFKTVVTLTRDMDGMIYDKSTDTWLPATPESLAAADTAIGETMSAMMDMVPFPIQTSIMGIISLDISRAQMDTALDKVRAAIRDYVTATTV